MEQINIYDMLVFEDELGSIYQDCVCSINRAYNDEDSKVIECNSFVIFLSKDCSINYINSETDLPVELKEIWTRTDEDTYKKVWELVDGKLTKISYSQGMKVYHRRQEVTYDQIKKFTVKDKENMG